MRTGRRELIRDMNRSLVLNLVRERTSLSRAELSRISGLSPSTVTAITASLLSDGFLVEEAEPGAPGKSSIGRPATQLRVNPVAGHVVGIKLAPDSLTATVTDLAASPLGIVTRPHGRDADPNVVGDLFESVVGQVVQASGIAESSLLGVGIGVPGVVDPDTGHVHDSPLPEWAEIDLIALLESRLGLPVLLDNDVNTLTIAEQLFGVGRGLAHFIVVTVGRGIGMGIVINGVVYRGARGGAGEIGHVQAIADGPVCWCGRRGCLEAVAAEPALVREVLASTGRLVAPEELAALAARDQRVARILEHAGMLVGRTISAMTTALDPERVVVSGEGVRLGGSYLEAIRTGLAQGRTDSDAIELAIEPWGDEAWARGAATLVLRELFHPAHLRDEGSPTASRASHGSRATERLARSGRGGGR
jgi:predicted NBD/HSP70 family sugar kinase